MLYNFHFHLLHSSMANSKFTQVETHPNWYRDIPVMHTLILGNFPPQEAMRHYHFFYPNKQNRFWKILSEIAQRPLNDYPRFDKRFVEERYQIMKQLCVGVQNIGAKIERKGGSSLDTNISIIAFRNIATIIQQHKELKRILLPGFSAESSTLKTFEKYLLKKRIAYTGSGKPAPEKTFSLMFKGRAIECIILNSTSTATSIPYKEILRQFKNWIVVP